MKKIFFFGIVFFLVNTFYDNSFAIGHVVGFQLPVEGTWLVLWGGLKEEDNVNHARVENQRYAYDLVKIDIKGKTSLDNPKELSDFFSYNESVFAPEDGVVIAVVDGVEDSLTPNPYMASGNMITIKHGKMYFYICHLQKGTILVREGESIRQGQRIAKSGSSGNTTTPHIHFHVTDSSHFYEGKGLPVPFYDILVEGVFKKSIIPKKGEKISNF